MYKKCENCYKDGKVPNEESCKKCEDDLKRKEQECERLRFPMQDTNYAILTKEEFKEYKKFKQNLIEIKEIASKVLLNTHDLEQFKDADALFGALLKIHKKISECEVTNDMENN